MNDNNFGNRLKELRKKSGFTQAQLADKLNISASTIGMYEQGRREPDNDTLTKLCIELHTSVDYLLGVKENTKYSNLNINSALSDFIEFIENSDNLMFNGQPINKNDRRRIADALRIATELSINNINENNLDK